MKKLALILLVVVMSATLILSGCAQKPAQVTGDLAKDQTLKMDLGVSEPETLDPAMQQGVAEFNVATMMYEGLTRMDDKNQPYQGVAEKWTVSADLLTYTFNLRKNAKWTNGDPVTAKDFEWSWKRAIDPRTGSPYAYQMYYIKGAEAANTLDPKKDEAKIKPALDAVGIKVVDDYTLQVTLAAPASYWLGLTSFPTYFPVHRATVEKLGSDKWATEAANFVTNGPFKMTGWTHKSMITMEKNTKYWDAKDVVLKKITIALVDDSKTELTMWESGQTDFTEGYPAAEIDRLKKENKLTILPYLGTYYYSFNVKKAPFDNAKVRQAFSLAINRGDIVNKILKAGQIPALAFVPPGIPDATAGSDFRKTGGDFYKDNDLAAANKLLDDAGYKDRSKIPTIEILYNTNPNHKTIAEAIQEMWSKGLNIPKEKIKLNSQEWGVYLSSRTKTHDFQVARAGWIGDYVDPMTFLDMFMTDNGNNDPQYANKTYDDLLNAAKKTGDQKVRMDNMHKAEKILVDDMVIAPIYYYVHIVLQKPYVKSVAINTIGNTDFVHAWIAKH